MMRTYSDEQEAIKLDIDSQDAWADTVTFYKSRRCDVKRLRVQLNGQPALDTGRVRTQLYSPQLKPDRQDYSKYLARWSHIALPKQE